MKRRTFLAGAAASLAAPSIAQTAWPRGQAIKIIVPFPAGAANDAMGRLAGQGLQDKLGATVVVENRPGGSAIDRHHRGAQRRAGRLHAARLRVQPHHPESRREGRELRSAGGFRNHRPHGARAAADGDGAGPAAEDHRRSCRRREGRAERLDLRDPGARRAEPSRDRRLHEPRRLDGCDLALSRHRARAHRRDGRPRAAADRCVVRADPDRARRQASRRSASPPRTARRSRRTSRRSPSRALRATTSSPGTGCGRRRARRARSASASTR